MQICCPSQQAGNGCLAGTRRAPENERTERTRCEHSRERAIVPEEMVLTYNFLELLWPQLIGKWTGRSPVEACRGEQTWPTRFGGRRHPLNTAEIFCPPRIMVIRQLRLGALVKRSRSRVLEMRCPLTSSITSPRWKPRLLA